MRPLLPIVVLAAVLAQPAPAQQAISGRVRDPDGGAIAGAEVRLAGRTAVTDSRGRFRADSIRPGNHPITIRARGFWPYRANLTVRQSPLELDFTLRPSFTELPEIVVEGRRSGIYGSVGDPASGGHAGARVEVVGYGGGAQLTDSAGRFGFPEAGRGDYLIIVSLAGYEQRRLSLRIDDGKARELAIRLYPGTEAGPGPMESWAFDDLRARLAAWPARTRMTGADFAKYQGVESVCDVARVRNAAGTGATIVLNGIMTLLNWNLCDFRADEVELIEFSRDAPMGRRRGALPSRSGVIYVWERR